MLRFLRLPSFRSTSLHTDVGAPPPDAFGPYRVLHQVGVGILGPVFRAYDSGRDRLVAVKLFRLDEPPDYAHRLVAELEPLVGSGLTHPAIVSPLAAGLSETSVYFVTDFASADTAATHFRGRTLQLAAEVRRVIVGLAEALDCAVAMDIRHGALHPRDVLVTEDEVRLTGLGIVQAFERAGLTPAARRPYAAPERLEGLSWTAAADVFSLGALAFEFLAGRRVVGVGADAASWLPDVAGVDAPTIQAVFARALAVDPDERYGSAGEFAQALSDALLGKPAEAGRSRTPRRSRRPTPRATSPQPQAHSQSLALSQAPAPTFDGASASSVADDVGVVVDVAVPLSAELATSGLAVDRPESLPSAAALAAASVGPLMQHVVVSGTDTPDLPLQQPVVPFAVVMSPAHVFAEAAVSNTAVWPLVLSLAVGIAVGFAGGYATAGRRAAIGSAAIELLGEVTAQGAAATTNVPANVATNIAMNGPASAPMSVPTTEVRPAARDIPLQPGVARQPATPPIDRRGQAAPASAPAATAAAAKPVPRDETRGRAGLMIQSQPSGGRVFLDGSPVGTTPLTLTRLTVGKHDVRIERQGYKPWSRVVTAVAGGRQRVAASLRR